MQADDEQAMDALWDAPTSYREGLFSDKIVLVSGGGSGIGRALALLYCRLGAHVAICGRRQERLDSVVSYARSRGRTMLGISANIRVPAEIDSMWLQLQRELGPLDILVNNAGGQFAQSAIDFSHKGWNAVIDSNLNGTWYMMQRAAQHWRDLGRGGTIVNIIAPVERGMPGIAHTVAARAGVVGLMNTVSVEWAPLGIRVNCLCPGLTDTEGLKVYPPEARAEFPRANLLKRPATAMEIAEACAFLTAPHSHFIVGEVLNVDGGYRLWGELWTAGRPDYYRFEKETPAK